MRNHTISTFAGIGSVKDTVSTDPFPSAYQVPAAERTVTIRNRYGLHGRPATLFVTLARTFASEISAARDEDPEEVDAKSVLGILTLGLEYGAALRIAARGADASEAIAALVDLVKEGFPGD